MSSFFVMSVSPHGNIKECLDGTSQRALPCKITDRFKTFVVFVTVNHLTLVYKVHKYYNAYAASSNRAITRSCLFLQ